MTARSANIEAGPIRTFRINVTATPAEFLGELNEVEVKYAPRVLFLRGDRELLRWGPRVSVIGSRRASAEGLRRARLLSSALVRHGVIVVSGLAAGIDRAAHEAAMDASGHTIAVLGTPLDKFYPMENRGLQERIGREHLLVSQFPSGYPTTPKNFPIRNRTMTLLTDATVIVEAGEQSGAIHQGWEALRLGRLLFLLETAVDNGALSWPAEMIRHGAQILSRDNLDAAIENLPPCDAETGFYSAMRCI